ncbi:MFS transporter [Termitidicoccus mucosus]|uniref:MFS transporter n=1 Tax=Termitidicoccus mucosus TaxID=1184151 RepID=A0A178IME3_9BACT|nr:hypothetical protein AW736_05430 [Opitutaceae bacterium TSB47]
MPPQIPSRVTASGHRSTSESDRVSPKEKFGIACGRMVSDGTLGALHVLINPIYNMTFGLNPALISTVVFIQRLWDAMLDPFCGQFSDNFRSRWGRRIPLIVVSAPMIAVLFVAIWWFPADAGEAHLFWHLLCVSLLFFVAHAVFAMSVGGLFVEATSDYHERTRLASLALAFGFAFLILSQWFYPLTQFSVFPSTVSGIRWVAVGCAVIFLIAGLMPAFLCHERNYAQVAARQPKVSLLANLRVVRNNRPFMFLISARFSACFGYNIVGILFFYMNGYYVFGGDLKRAAVAFGVVGSSFQIAALLTTLFVYPYLIKHFGKRRVLQMASCVLIFGCICKLIVYQPEQPWLQLIVISCNGIANAGFSIAALAMLGDIADYDELHTGLRREAVFTSLLNWFEKAGNSFGSLIAGFVLVWIGFDAKLGAQSGQTLMLMKFLYFLIPLIGALLSLIFIQRYELSEERVYQIKDELARRHAEQPITKTT